MVTIYRSRYTEEFPASYTLVASMNPCPCGYYNHPEKKCVCAPGLVQKYLNRVSGPLLDRIDLHVEVTPVSFDELTEEYKSESSSLIRNRVINARKVQESRFDSKSTYCNSQMSTTDLNKYCTIDKEAMNVLKLAMEKLDLSARAYDRILKVSRTIADLDHSKYILTKHLSEAIQYRSLDREAWAG